MQGVLGSGPTLQGPYTPNTELLCVVRLEAPMVQEHVAHLQVALAGGVVQRRAALAVLLVHRHELRQLQEVQAEVCVASGDPSPLAPAGAP